MRHRSFLFGPVLWIGIFAFWISLSVGCAEGGGSGRMPGRTFRASGFSGGVPGVGPGVGPGGVAPDFQLPDQNGQQVRLSQFRGQWVVLYFYPISDTPHCACKATAFTGLLMHLNRINAKVLAVNGADPALSRSSSKKYQVAGTVLADEEHQVARRYHVWQGDPVSQTQRVAVLIDPRGRLVRRLPIQVARGAIKRIQEALAQGASR